MAYAFLKAHYHHCHSVNLFTTNAQIIHPKPNSFDQEYYKQAVFKIAPHFPNSKNNFVSVRCTCFIFKDRGNMFKFWEYSCII